MRSRCLVPTASLLSLSVVVALAGCAADTGGATTSTDAPPPVVEHIHGIGLNPGDDAVYVATHQGLFRLGGSAPQPVGESRSDMMGFVITGPDTFFASGHPGHGETAPANLGLLRSTDAGERWDGVSQSGVSDFHDLAGVGDRLYGLDSSDGRLKTSADAGASWTDGPVLGARDVDVDPADPDRLVATTQDGLLLSTDGGETFAPHEIQPPALLLLAAHVPGGQVGATVSLAGLDQTGTLWVLDGTSWTAAGTPQGMPAAFAAIGGDSYLAAFGSTVVRTQDAGLSWLPQ